MATSRQFVAREPRDFQIAMFAIGTVLGALGLLVIIIVALWQHDHVHPPWILGAHVPGALLAVSSYLPWERWFPNSEEEA